ncbi:CDP-glucose 4,6-dehydratase [Leptospira bouyouniensis]|uniref:CDP-glucose 4,6-dehydratase n=1 Tax=Leptospira bouyouniensis TaxID=2484911 RepID=A0ABY2L3S9_9LEPT|nr:CDP-glucose 4,6-dehydratase [Leptospira bouyouniensis]TGK48578.1 CDP-glucose 4,6-dehydratase [Leptospira bouyouniensis]
MSLDSYFKNKKVLVTGHTGFKGSWLITWLQLMGAEVSGISLDPLSSPSHFEVGNMKKSIRDLRIDIRDSVSIEKAILEIKPDFVFHLAAQALVRKSYLNPLETWETNVMGTLNVLEALRKYDSPCSCVIITSDKCYDNVEWIWGYRENDVLGGPDPYSASKGAAELAIKSHIKSFFPKHSSQVRIVSARAGNVIGGGDWSEDRIIPDCVKAWSSNQSVDLRNPNATRPWQHVLEPLSGYLTLAVKLVENPDLHGEPFNFGPLANQNHSVLELVEKMSEYWDLVKWRDISKEKTGPYESGLLKLNCDKALALLKWTAVLGFEETVKLTSEWYKSYYSHPNDILQTTLDQIKHYQSFAKNKGLEWAS